MSIWMSGSGRSRVVPVRDLERERAASKPGDVKTWTMSPEQLEELRKRTGYVPPTDANGKRIRQSVQPGSVRPKKEGAREMGEKKREAAQALDEAKGQARPAEPVAQEDKDAASLMQKEEQVFSQETGVIAFRIPIQPAAVVNAERARIYDAIEAIGSGMEAADIDRGRVMQELFDLLQRVVNFVTADLTELHPGQEVEGFIHQFFDYYNQRHIDSVTAQQEVGGTG